MTKRRILPQHRSMPERRAVGSAGDQRMLVIVAAFRRGWTLEQIAVAAGISRQAVDQRLQKYEAQHGPISKVARCHTRNNARIAKRCLQCGRVMWLSVNDQQRFCSCSCVGLFARALSDQEIETIIERRRNGHSWAEISRLFKGPTQRIQTRIWIWLFERGRLNRQTVESIWHDPAHHWAYEWLERNTGLACAEHGANRITPTYPGRKSAWGASQRKEI
jgi:transcriptional regulator with XRE-family HTH domain